MDTWESDEIKTNWFKDASTCIGNTALLLHGATFGLNHMGNSI
jgi:hypothetical protein